MTGAEFLDDVPVVLAALVGVFDQQLDGGAGCFPLEHARQDFHRVCFFALCHVLAGARFAHIEPVLQHFRRYRHIGRTAINGGPDCRAVAFAPSGDAEHMAEGVV